MPDSDVAAAITLAEQEVTRRFGPDFLSADDYDFALLLLAAHYLAVEHRLITASYTIAGISESFALPSAREMLHTTVWGTAYWNLCRRLERGAAGLERTG